MRISDWSSDVCSSDLLVGFTPASILVAADSPVSPTDTPEDFMLRARGFPSQALGPTYLPYGPMLAAGDIVLDEWASQIYGATGELYNNQYCSLTSEDRRVGNKCVRTVRDRRVAN